jgi:hypothetical protein
MPTDRSTLSQNLPARLRRLSDQGWLELLVASLSSRNVAGIALPGFPSAEVQAQFTGSSREQTLQEAFGVYTFIRDTCAALGRPLGVDSRLLDFGVGWGRFLRIFIRNIAAENLYGCDIDPDVLRLCRELGLPGNLDRIYPNGKLPYPDGWFDAMYAYSVFTHLPEAVHLHWMRELARVSRPGCVFALTLEPRGFIDFVAGLGSRQDLQPGWHQKLATFAPRCPEFLADFDNGRIAYMPTGGGDHRDESVYGDAVVPLAFIEQNWSNDFKVHEYIDDPARFYQAMLVVQRR